MTHFIYILASTPTGPLHMGVTWNLRQRIDAHRMGLRDQSGENPALSLVWFEEHDVLDRSLEREDALRQLAVAQQKKLVSSANPEWLDLSEQIPQAAFG